MCLTVWLSRSECRKRSRITEGIRKLRSLDSGFGDLTLIKYSTSGADAFRGNTRTHPEHDG